MAASYERTGCVMRQKGDYEASLVELCKASETYGSVFGADHPDSARCSSHVDATLHKQADYDGAMVRHRGALAFFQSSYRNPNPQIAALHNRIGRVLLDKGDYGAAFIECGKAFDDS